MSRKLLVLAGLVAFGFGCGDDSLNEEDAQQGFVATNLVLTQGGAQAGASALQAVDFSYSCLEGGTATFVGSFDNTDGGGTFDYTVTFDSCVSQGVIISGSVKYFLSVTSSGDNASVVYNYKGNLGFAGEVDGDCELDLNSRVDTTASGGSFTYSGTLCGNDAGFMNGGTINFSI